MANKKTLQKVQTRKARSKGRIPRGAKITGSQGGFQTSTTSRSGRIVFCKLRKEFSSYGFPPVIRSLLADQYPIKSFLLPPGSKLGTRIDKRTPQNMVKNQKLFLIYLHFLRI